MTINRKFISHPFNHPEHHEHREQEPPDALHFGCSHTCIPQLPDPQDSGQLLDSTRSSFFTSNTPETPFAAMNASWLSASEATTPFSVTLPLFTMMWMGGMD